jgi:hypothetical protein
VREGVKVRAGAKRFLDQGKVETLSTDDVLVLRRAMMTGRKAARLVDRAD